MCSSDLHVPDDLPAVHIMKMAVECILINLIKFTQNFQRIAGTAAIQDKLYPVEGGDDHAAPKSRDFPQSTMQFSDLAIVNRVPAADFHSLIMVADSKKMQ